MGSIAIEVRLVRSTQYCILYNGSYLYWLQYERSACDQGILECELKTTPRFLEPFLVEVMMGQDLERLT